jgi:hypothetical protein
MLVKEEASASLSFLCSLSLSLVPSLKNKDGKSVYSYSLSVSFSLLPLKNIADKSIYSYSLSPSLFPPSFRRKHTNKVYRGSI